MSAMPNTPSISVSASFDAHRPLTLTDVDSPSTKHVIVGMSGGVDSSVSAVLLQQAGFMVEGLFMKNWEEDDGTEYCTAMDD
ncbi:MAG TPA: tRNA 2-thiouridine(34) synthase MnmA, partial [Psychrobacter sp.]|nr:tRNA 2-thiouridine(34) synthase MnmA [Psychrobacter sp.]